ncbi:hypothetical protein TSUD_140860 [Trifolium subterraneum]|uniref:Reverse transcriptase domain-containing protein n=1 Tax=Trifolium subterraneum TaxID=3900 RepID=A0A2Z6PEQ7_TRISU|nr:hypothetical protein TSUD_140860 [Trifolium subterraneum]
MFAKSAWLERYKGWPWTTNSISSEVKINKTLVWIRFPSLGMEYYDESLLLVLASAVGTPVKVDIHTLNASRGKFAIVCIKIDLDKPVIGKCCGVYGHMARNCITVTIRHENGNKNVSYNIGNNDKNGAPEKTTALTGLVSKRGPYFHPGGSSETPKVWTKKNKRARGMITNCKRPTNAVLKDNSTQPGGKSLESHPNYSQAGCLQNVAQESINFNKEVLGNFFARKNEVEARFQGIQSALKNIDSANLLRLQKELFTSYENILFQEEALWFQKSREQWVKLGSRNTSFFHAQCIICHKRNKIHGIRLSSGEWCIDPEVMKTEALNFFKELFCTNQTVTSEGNVNGMAVLDDDALRELVRPIAKKEVFDALMSMKSYKAPGPDGFQPIFFKLFWNEIGDDIWNFLKSAFGNGRYDTKVSETLIVLLPKVIVSRLRPFLDGIISPLQNSFIPGRSTKDNAFVLQEVLHSMRKSKKKSGDMVFKLDLEKAYNRVNWSFLKDTLVMFKFPPPVISLIMFGITSTSNTFLLTGSKTKAFAPKRGLRQGDPLSLYLFVLCMERLGALISKHVTDGRVRIARLQNVSLLGKLIWEVSNSPAKALHMMRDGFTFKIGDGNSRFWYDPLALKENLCSTVPFVAIQDTELKINDVGFNGRDVGKSRGCIIFIIMWFVWCSRNDAIFNNTKATMHNLVAKVHSMLSFCTAAFDNNTSGSGGNSEQWLVVWPRPAEGTVCLNVDWSMLGSLQTAGFGGLIRNSFGAFLKRLLWSIVCYSDSLQAVSLIKDGVSHFHTFANEIHIIRQLLRRNWNIVIDHILWEGNACADVLAKKCSSSNSPIVMLDSPPPELSNALSADARGVVFVRE